MTNSRIRQEDFAGLALALLAHGALIAALVLMPKPAPVPKLERVTVTLSDEVGEQASALSNEPAQTAQAPIIAPEPIPEPAPAPLPAPRPEPRVIPPPPGPIVRPVVKPPPPQQRTPAPQTRPVPPRPPLAATKPPPRQIAPPRSVTQPTPAGGASKLGNDFLKGVTGGDSAGRSPTPSGPVIDGKVRVSLAGEVLRQVRPNWQGRVPQGLNADRIVSILSVELNPDGNLARRPTLIGQEGVDETNRAQAQRHAEEAIRAVQLSAPFRLPPNLYNGWKKLPPLKFRKSIAQ